MSNNKVSQTTDVVEWGAICKLGSDSEDEPSDKHFLVSEYIQLKTGEQIILHDDRGFTMGSRSTDADGRILDARDGLTVELLEQTVRNVVLPDEEPCEEDHPYEDLALLAHKKNIDISSDDLRQLPYKVIIDANILSWLNQY